MIPKIKYFRNFLSLTLHHKIQADGPFDFHFLKFTGLVGCFGVLSPFETIFQSISSHLPERQKKV